MAIVRCKKFNAFLKSSICQSGCCAGYSGETVYYQPSSAPDTKYRLGRSRELHCCHEGNNAKLINDRRWNFRNYFEVYADAKIAAANIGTTLTKRRAAACSVYQPAAGCSGYLSSITVVHFQIFRCCCSCFPPCQ